MEGMQAYGAGKAGGAFDPVTFFQQPQTILRVVSWVSDRALQRETGKRDRSLSAVESVHRPIRNNLIIGTVHTCMGQNVGINYLLFFYLFI